MSDRRDWAQSLVHVMGVVIVFVSLAWVMELHRYVGLLVFTEQPLAVTLGIVAVAGFLMAAKGPAGRVAGLLAGLFFLGFFVWMAARYQWLSMAAMFMPEQLGPWMAAASLALLFLTWRLVGAAITVILLVFIALALWGRAVGFPSTPIDQLAVYLMLDPNGVLGLPLRVAVEIVVPFVLFGGVLQACGAGDWFTAVAQALFGRFRGGAAKVAVVASALLGSVSGNAVSNVVGTGVVTIPLMKKTGFRPATAGAVEAVASTGGQLLPPIMGSAAFVMADYLRVPYSAVAAAALIPALLYYIAVFLIVDRIAARDGLAGVRSQEGSVGKLLLEGAHFVVPFIVVLLAFMRFQNQPEWAAIAAIASLIVVSLIRPYKGERLTFKRLMNAVVDSGVSSFAVLVTCVAAGMLIGLINVTGVGFFLASNAIAASGGNLTILLLIVAGAAIILGMGMPTVAVYVLLATLLAPALAYMGLGAMQAHLFIFYFGMLSMVTPPIALAAVAAANLAGANMWATGWEAVRMAWVAYVIPFLFVWSPSLVMQGPVGAILATFVSAVLGLYAVANAAIGYSNRRIGAAARLVWLVVGFLFFVPVDLADWALAANVAGAVGLAVLVLWDRLKAPVGSAVRGTGTPEF